MTHTCTTHTHTHTHTHTIGNTQQRTRTSVPSSSSPPCPPPPRPNHIHCTLLSLASRAANNTLLLCRNWDPVALPLPYIYIRWYILLYIIYIIHTCITYTYIHTYLHYIHTSHKHTHTCVYNSSAMRVYTRVYDALLLSCVCDTLLGYKIRDRVAP